MTDEAKALVEECRLDAKAFRENTVYDSDGDPIRLIANANRLDQYADLIETQAREIERLREALIQYNDRLRSTAQIASRDGKETNWKSFRGQVQYTLAEYHELVKEARAALGESHD